MSGQPRKLTPQMRIIMWRLLYSKPVSNEELVNHLWQDDPDGGPLGARENIKVLISYSRKIVPVNIHVRWGYGYYISIQDMDKLHDFLVEELKQMLEKMNESQQRRLQNLTRTTTGLQDVATRGLGETTSDSI